HARFVLKSSAFTPRFNTNRRNRLEQIRLSALYVEHAATANGRKSPSLATIWTKTSGQNGVVK
ncbi:hypothetical protein, partial [Sulfitobacter sp.]|uniref:hypothetical protein n=1 Tax=Sulfitobacter sp. TaxID=1903071 RepID=UPI003F6C3E80